VSHRRAGPSFVGSLQLSLGPCPELCGPDFSMLANNPMTRYLFPEQSTRATKYWRSHKRKAVGYAVVSQGSRILCRNFYILRVFCFRITIKGGGSLE
jgi:hypothetical protein